MSLIAKQAKTHFDNVEVEPVQKASAQFTIAGEGFVTGLAPEDGFCLVGVEAIEQGQEVYISEYTPGQEQSMVCRWHGLDLMRGSSRQSAKTSDPSELDPNGQYAIRNEDNKVVYTYVFGEEAQSILESSPGWTAEPQGDVIASKKANREGWVVEIIEYYDDPSGPGHSSKFWYEDRNYAESYIEDFMASEDPAILRETEVKLYPGTEDGQATGQTVFGNKRATRKGGNPVGKKVTIKGGPDAGLTGLISREASGKYFVEIEGMEAGPYRKSNLIPERQPKTSKKTANFAGQYVWVEADGEWFQGFVHEDDGGPTVEVSDPEDDPYMVGAPVELPREQVFREIPNTAKKAAHDPFDDGYQGAPDFRVGDKVETHLGDGVVIENPYGGEKLWVGLDDGSQIPIDSPGVALISGGVTSKQAASDDFYDGSLQELVAALQGKPTGSFIEDASGKRLSGMKTRGTPGVNFTVVLEFKDKGY